MRGAVGVVSVAVVTGCVPEEVPKQAEAVSSVAAEASLLAHDASEGSSTATFTREHAKALRRNLERVRGAIGDPRLGGIAAEVARGLDDLAAEAGDERRAGVLSARFDVAAKAADKLAR